MRRLKYLISWMIIATLVAGCGKKSNDDSETSLTTSEATTEMTTTEEMTTETTTEAELSEEEIFTQKVESVLFSTIFYMPYIQDAGFEEFKFLENGEVWNADCVAESDNIHSISFDEVSPERIRKYKWFIDADRKLLVVDLGDRIREYEFAEELGGFAYDYDCPEDDFISPPSCYEIALVPLGDEVTFEEVWTAYKPYMDYFGDNDISEPIVETEQDSNEAYSIGDVEHAGGNMIWSDWAQYSFAGVEGDVSVLVFMGTGDYCSIFAYNDPEEHPEAHVVFATRPTSNPNVVVAGVSTLGLEDDILLIGMYIDEDGRESIDIFDLGTERHSYYKRLD